MTTDPKLDPKLDLVLERVVDVSPKLMWEAWTTPEHLKHWFVPKPWTVASCEIDLRPGGRFDVVMRSPEGQDFPNAGCYLEIVPERRLVWTNALQPGWRPATESFLFFTGIIELAAEGKGTRYTATALHRDGETRKKHEEMGFHSGWGTVLDQLVVYAKATM